MNHLMLSTTNQCEWIHTCYDVKYSTYKKDNHNIYFLRIAEMFDSRHGTKLVQHTNSTSDFTHDGYINPDINYMYDIIFYDKTENKYISLCDINLIHEFCNPIEYEFEITGVINYSFKMDNFEKFHVYLNKYPNNMHELEEFIINNCGFDKNETNNFVSYVLHYFGFIKDKYIPVKANKKEFIGKRIKCYYNHNQEIHQSFYDHYYSQTNIYDYFNLSIEDKQKYDSYDSLIETLENKEILMDE